MAENSCILLQPQAPNPCSQNTFPNLFCLLIPSKTPKYVAAENNQGKGADPMFTQKDYKLASILQEKCTEKINVHLSNSSSYTLWWDRMTQEGIKNNRELCDFGFFSCQSNKFWYRSLTGEQSHKWRRGTCDSGGFWRDNIKRYYMEACLCLF